jgi:hypothetical protein
MAGNGSRRTLRSFAGRALAFATAAVPALVCCLSAPTAGAEEPGTMEVRLREGVQYLRVLSAPEETTVEQVFGDKLPGGTAWQRASRIVTADRPDPLGCYYDSEARRWRGSLERIEQGRAYWLALPPGAGQHQLSLAPVRIAAGYVPGTSVSGVLVTGRGRALSVQPGPPPSSSASYREVEEPVTHWGATTGVYLQQGSAGGIGGERGYVRVELDSLTAVQGAREVVLPLPGGPLGAGVIAAPAPDLSRPPWGSSASPGEGEKDTLAGPDQP